MKIKLKPMIVPNFINTDKGWVSIASLDDNEVDAFLELYSKRFREHHKRKVE